MRSNFLRGFSEKGLCDGEGKKCAVGGDPAAEKRGGDGPCAGGGVRRVGGELKLVNNTLLLRKNMCMLFIL